MKIEIQQTSGSGVYENSVFDLTNRKRIYNQNNSQLTGMNRHFTDDQVFDLIGEKQYTNFMLGKSVFNVTKKQIFEVTNNLDYFTMPK